MVKTAIIGALGYLICPLGTVPERCRGHMIPAQGWTNFNKGRGLIGLVDNFSKKYFPNPGGRSDPPPGI